MGTNNYLEFSMSELIAQARDARTVKSVQPTGSMSNALDLFPKLSSVLGVWSLKAMPSVKIQVVKLNQLDKRSMSALYLPLIYSIGGKVVAPNTGVPNGLLSDSGDPEQIKRNISLASIVAFLDLSDEALADANETLQLFDNMVSVAVARGEKKGYLDVAYFQDNLKAVQAMMASKAAEAVKATKAVKVTKAAKTVKAAKA